MIYKRWYILDTSINKENKYGTSMGEINIYVLRFGNHGRNGDYHDNLFSHGLVPIITKPTSHAANLNIPVRLLIILLGSKKPPLRKYFH